MDELLELRTLVQNKEYHAALLLIDEMEEMGRNGMINNIKSDAVVLLLHLIKQSAEKRTTRSWEQSIYNSAEAIKDLNARYKSGGVYLQQEEIAEIIHSAYPRALRNASYEAFEGRYSAETLGSMIGRETIEAEALAIIWEEA